MAFAVSWYIPHTYTLAWGCCLWSHGLYCLQHRTQWANETQVQFKPFLPNQIPGIESLLPRASVLSARQPLYPQAVSTRAKHALMGLCSVFLSFSSLPVYYASFLEGLLLRFPPLQPNFARVNFLSSCSSMSPHPGSFSLFPNIIGQILISHLALQAASGHPSLASLDSRNDQAHWRVWTLE